MAASSKEKLNLFSDGKGDEVCWLLSTSSANLTWLLVLASFVCGSFGCCSGNEGVFGRDVDTIVSSFSSPEEFVTSTNLDHSWLFSRSICAIASWVFFSSCFLNASIRTLDSMRNCSKY